MAEYYLNVKNLFILKINQKMCRCRSLFDDYYNAIMGGTRK